MKETDHCLKQSFFTVNENILKKYWIYIKDKTKTQHGKKIRVQVTVTVKYCRKNVYFKFTSNLWNFDIENNRITEKSKCFR